MDVTAWSKGLSVEVGGHGVVSHVGSGLLRLTADRVGLTSALSTALARPGFWPVHDRGRVLTDLAVVIADGARTISEIDTLRHQGELFGSVASDTTVWRALEEITPGALGGIATARARVRAQVWRQIVARHGRIPPARVAGRDLGEVTVIRLDASIVLAHSDKQQAGPTFKKTFGFHPLTAWCDNTDESLVIKLRPGRAGSNTAADHIEVLTEAIAQIPAPHRHRILITCDGAGSTHALVEHISALNNRPGAQVHYSVGFDFDERIRAVTGKVPTTGWQPALDAAGDPRDDAQVADHRPRHGGSPQFRDHRSQCTDYRADLLRPRRDPASHRARCRAGADDGAGADLPCLERPISSAHRRCPHGDAPPADPGSVDRLESRVAQRR
ncbi:MAG: transposase [Pseudonocardiaceae bacterium]